MFTPKDAHEEKRAAVIAARHTKPLYAQGGGCIHVVRDGKVAERVSGICSVHCTGYPR